MVQVAEHLALAEQEAQLVVQVELVVDRIVGWAVVMQVPHVAENLVAQSLNFAAAVAPLWKLLTVQDAAVPPRYPACPAEFAPQIVPLSKYCQIALISHLCCHYYFQ